MASTPTRALSISSAASAYRSDRAKPMDPVNIPPGFTLAQTPETASKRLLPWLVAVAFFMESLDTTIIKNPVTAI
jgi:hypothetical protein